MHEQVQETAEVECRYLFTDAQFILLGSKNELSEINIELNTFKVLRTFMALNIGDIDNRILSLMIHKYKIYVYRL
jgi:hypothetical protein